MIWVVECRHCGEAQHHAGYFCRECGSWLGTSEWHQVTESTDRISEWVMYPLIGLSGALLWYLLWWVFTR
jgi:hypothetical protein